MDAISFASDSSSCYNAPADPKKSSEECPVDISLPYLGTHISYDGMGVRSIRFLLNSVLHLLLVPLSCLYVPARPTCFNTSEHLASSPAMANNTICRFFMLL